MSDRIEGTKFYGPLVQQWLAPLEAFAISVAFAPGWAGAATSPRWAFATISCYFVRWPCLPFIAYCFWKLGINLGAHWAIICGAFCWGLNSSEINTRRVVAWFAAGVGVSSFVAIIQYYGGWAGVEQLNVPAGLFLNKNMLGEAAALAIVASLAARLFWPALICAPALLLSTSRTAWLAVTAVLVLQLSWRWRLLSLAALCLGLFYFHDTASLAQRFELWRAAVHDFSWLGNGPYDFSTVINREPNLHNDFLQRIYELGFVGLVPILAFCLAAQGAPTFGLAFGIIAMFGFPVAVPASAWFGAFVLGHGLVLLRNESKIGRAHV